MQDGIFYIQACRYLRCGRSLPVKRLPSEGMAVNVQRRQRKRRRQQNRYKGK